MLTRFEFIGPLFIGIFKPFWEILMLWLFRSRRTNSTIDVRHFFIAHDTCSNNVTFIQPLMIIVLSYQTGNYFHLFNISSLHPQHIQRESFLCSTFSSFTTTSLLPAAGYTQRRMCRGYSLSLSLHNMVLSRYFLSLLDSLSCRSIILLKANDGSCIYLKWRPTVQETTIYPC